MLHWYEMQTDLSTCRLNHIGIWYTDIENCQWLMIRNYIWQHLIHETTCCLICVDSVPHGLHPRNESIHGCPNVSTRTTAPVPKVISKSGGCIQDGENEPRPAVGMGMDRNGWERWRLVKQDEPPTSNLERVGVETIYTDESALWHRTGFRNILYAISITRTLVFAASDRLPWLVLSKLAKNLISCSPFWYESKCLDHIGPQNGWSNTENEKHCGAVPSFGPIP